MPDKGNGVTVGKIFG